MRDINILSYVASTLWALTAEKWAELTPVLVRHMLGERLTAEDIEARIGTRPAMAPARQGAIGVLPIRGVIAHRADTLEAFSGGTSTEVLTRQFRALMADTSVGTILLDVDSPGGTVVGVNELAGEIAAARGIKPVVAFANSQMASAAYWIASAAEEIVSIPNPTPTIGSIGVFSAHEDISRALESKGIKVTLISAGTYKTEGNPFEPLTPEGRAVRQAQVDAAYGQFVATVAANRGTTQKAVREGYGEGRQLSSADALKAGLIDRIGTFDETVNRLTSRKAPAAMRAEAHESVLAVDVDRMRRWERF